MQQILFDELFPLNHQFRRDSGVSVSRQIDEVELSVDPIKIHQLRASGPGACERQVLLAGKAVQQTGLTDVASSQKRNFRERFGWKLLRVRRTYHKLRVHPVPVMLYAQPPARLPAAGGAAIEYAFISKSVLPPIRSGPNLPAE